MGLRDILKKKDDLSTGQPPEKETVNHLAAPEFAIFRSDTTTQERIYPPSVKSIDNLRLSAEEPTSSSKPRRSLDVFRSGRSRSASESSQNSKRDSGHRRLSQRLHLSRAAPQSSESVPDNLPEIIAPHDPHDKDGAESQWEKRATILASQNDRARSTSRPATPVSGDQARAVSTQEIDHDIQEAIRLHEEGNLEHSTRVFGRLADPQGANNPLSQVLYGLALRHGWGCAPNPEGAVKYLSAAASNSASIEQLALQAGMKKGGAAKGELVLAIFELANCFRHGWGIHKDPYAAKQYYETAANLGDTGEFDESELKLKKHNTDMTDAMNEIAWCYLEGFGCKKDKFAAARYYRLAEKAGNKTLGNTWIWKEKYDPPGEGGSRK